MGNTRELMLFFQAPHFSGCSAIANGGSGTFDLQLSTNGYKVKSQQGHVLSTYFIRWS